LGDPGALGRAGGEGEGGPPGGKKKKGKTAKSGGGAYPGAAAGRAFRLKGRSRVGTYAPGQAAAG
jgi:hypothetical protein